MRETPFVLVVEDDDDARESMLDLLGAEGWSARGVPHGAAALELLGAGVIPLVILLDLGTPVMDGWEFLRWRGQIEGFAAIPVIVVSADPRRHEALELGAVAVVNKPTSPARLLRLMTEVLGAAWAVRGPALAKA